MKELLMMKKTGNFNFKVGQLAETKSFEVGYRGAWFRCKIKDIQLEDNKILAEYYDFEPKEVAFEKIHQKPPYARKSRHIKKQLMVRPQYPVMCHKSEMPTVTEKEACILVIDGPWKVGDLVDWNKDGCFWSARIVRVLSDDKYQVELPMPPSGEGKEEDKGKHVACGKDLRPFLEWSQTRGWTLLTEDGQPSCDAHLVFPTKQGMDMEVEEHAAEAAAAAVSPVNASSTTCRISGEGDNRHKNKNENEKVRRDTDLVESSQSTSSLSVEKIKAVAVAADEMEEEEEDDDGYDNKRELNIMREETADAAILDLEELVCKVEWMQAILQSATAAPTSSSSWKLA